MTATIQQDSPKAELCGLTENQFKRFSSACWATYSAIGGDMGDGGRSQKVQIEFICDADYIRMYGERNRGRNAAPIPWATFYDETISPMIRGNYGTKPFMAMMKKVFPHSRYE
jgi:hypothetical protein